jgi:tetratricopeptide (TPR) repeat protein
VGVVRLVDPQTDREVLKLTGPGAASYHPACFTSDSAKLIAVAGDTSALYVWDLRLIRKQLRELGMDWELPEFPAPAADNPPPLTVELDPGMLRPRSFENDRQAVAALSIALALQPVNPEAHRQRGLAFDRLKDSARAVKDFEMFLALAAADDPRRAEIGFARAKNYRNLRNSRDVLDSLAQLADTPAETLPWPADYARRCNEIAWFYVKPRNARVPDAVLRVTQKAVALEPFNFFFVNTHGVALYRAGRYQEATHWLEKNLEMSREHIAFDLYFLAMSHERLGQSAKARAYFDRANASAQAETGLAKNFLDELAGFRVEAEEVLGISKTK